MSWYLTNPMNPEARRRAVHALAAINNQWWDPEESGLLAILPRDGPTVNGQAILYEPAGQTLADAVTLARYAQRAGLDLTSPTVGLVSKTTMRSLLGAQMAEIICDARAGVLDYENLRQVMRRGHTALDLHDVRLHAFSTLKAAGCVPLEAANVLPVLQTSPPVYAYGTSQKLGWEETTRWLLEHPDVGPTFQRAGVRHEQERTTDERDGGGGGAES